MIGSLNAVQQENFFYFFQVQSQIDRLAIIQNIPF